MYDFFWRLLIVFSLIIIFTLIILIFLGIMYPQYFIVCWNRHIKAECDRQDKVCINGIPSYKRAWDCGNETIQELHTLIRINHDDILKEILDIKSKKNNKFSSCKLFHKYENWNASWIRFLNKWKDSAEKIPTLKKIISLFPNIVNFYIVTISPGNTILDNKNYSRLFLKYHYVLKLPSEKNPDLGLKIKDFIIKLEEKEGYVWDDTLSHTIWNYTTEPYIIIFADIFREFSFINKYSSSLAYSILTLSN